MNWNDLTMAQKNELMQTYIRNGVTSLEDMRGHFNSFADGGPKKSYKEWAGQMQKKYPWLEMDSKKAGYDYERYFNENYEDAIARLAEAEARHFTDRYKLANHPTYSNESVYSQGPRIGGEWTNDDKFIPSVINKQQYPKVYDQDRAYTEEEIYDRLHKFDKGGPKKVRDNRLHETHPELFASYNVNIPFVMQDEVRANALLEEKKRRANALAAEFVLKEGIENTVNSPYYNKERDRWVPQESVEGGADTIGKGLKMNNVNTDWYKTLKKQGYLTNAQMEKGVQEMMTGFYDKAKNIYNEQHGDYAWDALAPEKQSLLMDYAYNGVLNQFPKFMQAVHDNDRDSILNEYKRHVGKKELKTRNRETLNLINNIWP